MASLQSNDSHALDGTAPFAHEPFGSSFTRREDAGLDPEEAHEIIEDLAKSSDDIKRFNDSFSAMVAGGNVSLHRSVVETPTSIEQMPNITIEWRKIQVTAGQKVLLKYVSGLISGGITAVMGPSGSGKTTLLNAIFGRLGGTAQVDFGEITFNGLTVDRPTIKRLVGYVTQDDIASPYLTVRETLRLIASLRFRHIETKEQIEQRVTEVLATLSLDHCADTVIGHGLSGGERKRLAIAVELLSFPRFLVLDEPTSSLDSLEALQLVQCLKRLVEEHGICVICTIHQPQYKVFSIFERLILLADGRIIYDGPTSGVSAFCEKRGFPVKPGENPADVVMNVASVKHEEEQQLQRVPSLVKIHRSGDERIDEAHLRDLAPRHLQYLTLTKRSFIMSTRKRSEYLIAIFQTILNAFLIGTVFLNLSNQASKSQTRLSALFYCCVNQGTFGAISTLNVFSSERVLSLRDRSAGHYYAFPYYAAKVSCEFACRAPFSILFSCIVYWLLALEYEPGHFFFFTFVMWLTNMSAVSLAMMVSVWFRLQEISSLVLPLALELMRLFGTFFLAPVDASPGLSWLMKISYLSYGYGAVAHNDMDDRVFDCATTPCLYPATGAAKLKSLGLDELSMGENVAGLICFVVFCQVMTYIGVRFVVW